MKIKRPEPTIDELNLSTRAYNALMRDGIKYIHQVIALLKNTKQDRLPDIKNLGALGLSDLVACLLSHRHLWDEADLPHVEKFQAFSPQPRKKKMANS